MSDNRSLRSFNNLKAVSVLVQVRLYQWCGVYDTDVRRQRSLYHLQLVLAKMSTESKLSRRMIMVVVTFSKCLGLYSPILPYVNFTLSIKIFGYLREIRMSWNIDTDIKHISTGIDFDHRHKYSRKGQ